MLGIFTIVLDGEPYIEQHLATFERLSVPWRWVIVEGASSNLNCTAWCKPQEPRLSLDGTTEYLQKLKGHPHVKVLQQPFWPGKISMVNAAVAQLPDATVLMEIDADEIWNRTQLETIINLFREHPYAGAMKFDCRYFVGPDIITVGEGCFGANSYEWHRAWRAKPGGEFTRHEPPVYPHTGVVLDKPVTRNFGLIFDHFAYATEAQVRYKQDFYGYPGLVDGWKRLQANTVWPVRLDEFFPFVDNRVMARRV